MSLLVLFDSRGAGGGGHRKQLYPKIDDSIEKWSFKIGIDVLKNKTINIVYDKELDIGANIKAVKLDENIKATPLIIQMKKIKKRKPNG